jgi:hypothetical protein
MFRLIFIANYQSLTRCHFLLRSLLSICTSLQPLLVPLSNLNLWLPTAHSMRHSPTCLPLFAATSRNTFQSQSLAPHSPFYAPLSNLFATLCSHISQHSPISISVSPQPFMCHSPTCLPLFAATLRNALRSQSLALDSHSSCHSPISIFVSFPNLCVSLSLSIA